MRILLDECVPSRLHREFVGHDAHTVSGMGWAGKKNGELISLMISQNFEVLVTVDQNLRYQTYLRAARIAVIVMVATSNRLADLVPLMPSVLAALQSIKPADLIEIKA